VPSRGVHSKSAPLVHRAGAASLAIDCDTRRPAGATNAAPGPSVLGFPLNVSLSEQLRRSRTPHIRGVILRIIFVLVKSVAHCTTGWAGLANLGFGGTLGTGRPYTVGFTSRYESDFFSFGIEQEEMSRRVLPRPAANPSPQFRIHAGTPSRRASGPWESTCSHLGIRIGSSRLMEPSLPGADSACRCFAKRLMETDSISTFPPHCASLD